MSVSVGGRRLSIASLLAFNTDLVDKFTSGLDVETGVPELLRIPTYLLADAIGHYKKEGYAHVSRCIMTWLGRMQSPQSRL